MRIFLLALWFSAIVFAVLELTGVSRFGELSRIPALVSFVLTLVVFVPFLASGFDWFSRFLLALPLSRARRKTFRNRRESRRRSMNDGWRMSPPSHRVG
ncbi:hypothetical protein [Microbacterium abyssi]|uniref:hypothetical protein n=1 Tax=Microbacterium abyssi TaxID=2782166 RepID=UPI001887B4A0|nr:hypothetical protein [Microbacterium sp. A18JL241]